jgi:hypothetical protein
MFKFYSEVQPARARELFADLLTWAWVALWTVVGFRVHEVISGFAEAGRVPAMPWRVCHWSAAASMTSRPAPSPPPASRSSTSAASSSRC